MTAADLLNDRVLPCYADHGIPLRRVLTDRGTEYGGAPDRPPSELDVAVEDIDHTRGASGGRFRRLTVGSSLGYYN